MAGLPASERSRVWRVAAWKSFRHWQTWLSIVGVGLLTGIGQYIGASIGSGRIDQFIGIGAGAFLGGFIHGQVTIAYTRPYLRGPSNP